MAKEFEGIDNILKDMRKKFGDGAIFHGSKDTMLEHRIPRWPLDSPSLSYVLGGGVPQGRIIEIYGPEAAGKTTLAIFLAAQIQKSGGQVLYVDFENALDIDYAATLGFDKNAAFFSQPNSGEEGLNIIESMCREGEIDYVLVDSVAAITPQAEIDGEMGDQQMGLQARLMGKALRKIGPLAKENGVTVLFLNQIREKLGTFSYNPETTPGGRALKFWSSIRLDMRRKEYVMDGANYIGILSRVKAIKNKTAPPMRQAEIEIRFGDGVQYHREFVDFGIEKEIIKKAGAWLTLNDEDGNEIQRTQGKAKMVEYLRENAEQFESLKERVYRAMDMVYS